MAKKGQIFKKYSPEFKLSVILDMRNNHLGYGETVRKYWGQPVGQSRIDTVRNLDYGNANIQKKDMKD